MFKTEFPMNQAEMYMECLIPQEELAKWFLQLASASGLLGGTYHGLSLLQWQG